MSRRPVILSAVATICLFALLLGVLLSRWSTQNVSAAPNSVFSPAATTAFSGTWLPGPNIPASLWSGSSGEGFARFSGHFYSGNKRIYFLGGRREDISGTTTGAIFYFNPVTRLYSAVTNNIPNPVSNYSISQIDDDQRGHGPGLYIIGGRLTTGAQTKEVKVFYPNDNTVATIATDPFPGTAQTPGGQAVVDEKIYVFGGFDSSAMYTKTYVYNPAAAAGSRWSDLNCPLPTARSYIATAVVGRKIYAIGGDEYVGGTLTPIQDTLVLDTDHLASCWQDGLMADLPAGFANGDAPAVYVAEGRLSGGIYVVGGYWPTPGPYNWVFRYDLSKDTWDTAFPPMITRRRNQALVYVPLSAGTRPNISGLWTFGGYDGTDTNAMTNSSEYFPTKASTFLPVAFR